MLDPTITHTGEGTIHRRNILGFLKVSAKYLGVNELPSIIDNTMGRARFTDTYGAGFNPPPSQSASRKYEPVA